MQRQIATQFELKVEVTPPAYVEWASCPFCGTRNEGVLLKPNGREPRLTCLHFNGFVAGAGGASTIFFEGPGEAQAGTP